MGKKVRECLADGRNERRKKRKEKGAKSYVICKEYLLAAKSSSRRSNARNPQVVLSCVCKKNEMNRYSVRSVLIHGSQKKNMLLGSLGGNIEVQVKAHKFIAEEKRERESRGRCGRRDVSEQSGKRNRERVCVGGWVNGP